MKESIQTFSDPDGSSKKGDILVTSPWQAMNKLKEMIEDTKSKTKNAKKNAQWDFKSCPCDQFGKTLDDTFMCFIKWAKVKKDEATASAQNNDQYNVSKVSMRYTFFFSCLKTYLIILILIIHQAFRRVKSYAEWMEESSEDLVDPPLTAASVKDALDAFKMRVSTDKEGNFVWWFDLKAIDKKLLKEGLKPEESLRAFVWYAHYILYDKAAQDNGMIIVENCAKMGFFEIINLMPMKLGAKLDRLTIGVLPIKCKKIYILEEPGWMKMLMKVLGMFLSKKMKSRIVSLKEWDKVGEILGEECIPKNFGPLEGKMETDPVEKAYFSN